MCGYRKGTWPQSWAPRMNPTLRPARALRPVSFHVCPQCRVAGALLGFAAAGLCACLRCVPACYVWTHAILGVSLPHRMFGGGVQEVGGRGRPCHVLQWFSVNQSRGHDCPLAYTAYMRPWVYTKVVQIVHLPPAPGFLFWPACLSILVGWLCWVCAGTGHRTWPCFGCLTAVCLNGLCWCASREDWWLCFGGSLLCVSMSGLRGHGLYAV